MKKSKSELKTIDYSKKENQIGCGYCANEKDCTMRDPKINKAKQGCKDWRHFEDLDLTKINNLQFDGIDHEDFPKYCDAFIMSADYNGKEMTEEQLDELNEDREFVHEKLFDYLQ